MFSYHFKIQIQVLIKHELRCYRVMASSILGMWGRSGSVAYANLIGHVLFSHCEIAFLSVGGILFCKC